MACDPHRQTAGFTLVEVVLGMFILAVCVIATAPLFVYAAKENAVGGDLGTVGALAVHKMEELRGTDFAYLGNGGDLDSDVTGYHDTPTPGFTVRWVIMDNPNPPASTKVIRVRAIAERQVIGQAKDVTVVVVRGG